MFPSANGQNGKQLWDYTLNMSMIQPLGATFTTGTTTQLSVTGSGIIARLEIVYLVTSTDALIPTLTIDGVDYVLAFENGTNTATGVYAMGTTSQNGTGSAVILLDVNKKFETGFQLKTKNNDPTPVGGSAIIRTTYYT